MLRALISHPTAANLIMLAFIVLGLGTLPQLKKETFPEVEKYEVMVRVPYPGAGPRDVEDGICRPLEEATDSISFVEEKRCEARSNLGIMTLKMLEEGNFDDFLDDVRSALDSIDNFPDNAEAATVEEVGRTSPVVTVALSADLSRPALKDLAEEVKARMLQDPAIPLVTLEGFSQRELRVSLDPAMVRRYGLSLRDIAGRIARQNTDLPVGSIVTDHREYDLRFSDERITAEGLAELRVIRGDTGAEVALGDIATIRDSFRDPEDYVTFDGKEAALLAVSKNSTDDSLTVLSAVKAFVERMREELPEGARFQLTRDYTSIVRDRLTMMLDNAWQGLVLVFLTLMLFFRLRYTFWVVMGLPVSFLGAFFFLSFMGVSVNLMSLVALLLALGILMDDAIVISESIATQLREGKAPTRAAMDGLKRVGRGVFSSFVTTVCIFAAMVGLSGDLGQVLRVVPIVLLTVVTVSLIEAFFILPNHLRHAMEHGDNEPRGGIQKKVQETFERWREGLGDAVETAVRYRYALIGVVLALFLVSTGLIVGKVLKFSALPEMDGDVLEARLIMPAGTPLDETEARVAEITAALEEATAALSEEEPEALLKHTTVTFGKNPDAFEQGPHLATISADLLTAERRHTTLDELIEQWRGKLPVMPDVVSLIMTEPALGPAGRAIYLRLAGVPLKELDQASHRLTRWLEGYPGVYNVFSDLRPGKPEIRLRLKAGATHMGLDAATLAEQLRAAWYGVKISEVYRGRDNLEILVRLTGQPGQGLDEFERFPIIHPRTGAVIPLETVADFSVERDYSRIQRVDNRRVVSVYGSVNTLRANTEEVVNDTVKDFLPQLRQDFPGLEMDIEGELENSRITQASLRSGFLFGLIGVFILLSFQFRSYLEPVIVMLAIPLALIGVVAGHLLMGYNLSLPSLVGFVSLAGIVVNNSILLVEFVKMHAADGHDLIGAAREASKDRLRAILLTTSTTVAGLLPLLFETSLQAQVLIPLVISIAFGLVVSTVLVLFVVPCFYGVLEDWRGRA